jgi:predicted TIM-barrel fold metal-dependent hydrolase
VIDGIPVVDAVVHPYALQADNWMDELGEMQRVGAHRQHILYNKDKRYGMPQDLFLSNLAEDAYGVAHAEFAESDVDLAVIHSLPNLGFTRGPVAPLESMARMRDLWPDRFLLYGTFEYQDTDAAIAELERQVREYRIDGLKFYPAVSYDGGMRHWRLDDGEFATPVLEAARDLGIRNVAVHKAVRFGGAPMDSLRVNDLEGPLGRFPEINFHMVHAGYAFLEETRILMTGFPNLYANLESTMAFVNLRPRVFAETLGEFLFWSGAERVVFASGINILHPRPLVEEFARFEMPADLMEERGYPALTDEMKALILGGNIARAHGIDMPARLAAIEGDEFQKLKADGLRPPWSALTTPGGQP